MFKRGDKAPDLRLRDSSGAEVSLADLWRERPLVLVFLRHFG
jgi:peroxiredoxin